MEYCIFCMNSINDNSCPCCGKNNRNYKPAPHHLVPGTILNGKYLVGAVLGEGGFGITYIGLDTVLNLKVAIKEYFPSGVVNRNNTSSTEITAHVGSTDGNFEKGKQRFLEEARTLAAFADETSIVSVKDFFSENNTVYIVMEYLEGTDLKCYLENNGTMSFNDAFKMLSPVLNSLSKVHEKGLIHRDISPSNIMILSNGTVKLLDFGAARNITGLDQKSLSVMLKPGFAPEEQYRTKGNQGPWTDVYALSATMYKMITGITPDDAMNRLYKDELKAPSEINPCVNTVQDAVILKGMAIRQEERYQNVNEFLSACEQARFEDVNTGVNDEEKTVVGTDDMPLTPPTVLPPYNNGEKTITGSVDDETVTPPPPVDTVYCPNCHALISAYSSFCPKCGFNVKEQPQADNIQPKKKSKKKRNIIIAIVVALVALSIFGNIMEKVFQNNTDNNGWTLNYRNENDSFVLADSIDKNLNFKDAVVIKSDTIPKKIAREKLDTKIVLKIDNPENVSVLNVYVRGTNTDNTTIKMLYDLTNTETVNISLDESWMASRNSDDGLIFMVYYEVHGPDRTVTERYRYDKTVYFE